MIKRLSPYVVTLFTMLLTAAMIIAPAPAALADDPSSWTQGCRVPGLALAPVVSGDKDNDGSPVKLRPDARGKYVPVVYIHGWTSTSIHDEAGKGAFSAKPDLLTSRIGTARPARTLIGNVQDLGGTAPFTFDYATYASRWVTDDNIGPALAKTLSCLHEKSGEKVVVVTHSMGGLATRQALAVGGPDLISKISQVITFGTPNTGSIGAAFVAAGANAAAVPPGLWQLFRLWLSYCGKLKSEDQNRSDLLCWSFLPHALTSFDSEAAQALRSGSRQLKELAPWPAGLPVHSLAGATEFTIIGQGMFKQQARSETGAGDIIVTLGSAQAGVTTKKSVSCAYELEALTNEVNDIRVDWLGIATKNEVSRKVDLLETPIPCYHENLMRNTDLALEQLGLIADDLARRIPPTKFLTVRPWTDGTANNPDRVIEGEDTIECHSSDYVIRADAYQCRGRGNSTGWWDPCFKNPSTSSYLCIVDKGRVLIENGSLERQLLDFSPEESNPFRVDLADGTTCWRRQGGGPPAIVGYPYWMGVCMGPRAGAWRERGDKPNTRDESLRGVYDRTSEGVWHIAIEEDATPGRATLYPAQTVYR